MKNDSKAVKNGEKPQKSDRHFPKKESRRETHSEPRQGACSEPRREAYRDARLSNTPEAVASREKMKWKGGTLLAPVPTAMVSCGSMDKPNIITIGWTGILCSDPPKTYISVRPSRYSYEILKDTRKFVINLTTEALVRAADYCGVRSGRDTDKFADCRLTAVPALSLTDTPMIAESPLSIECEVSDVIPLGSHDMFLADIVSIAVDPALVDENGALHLERAALSAYSHGDYFALGKKLGDFGFSVRKKKRQTVKKTSDTK